MDTPIIENTSCNPGNIEDDDDEDGVPVNDVPTNEVPVEEGPSD